MLRMRLAITPARLAATLWKPELYQDFMTVRLNLPREKRNGANITIGLHNKYGTLNAKQVSNHLMRVKRAERVALAGALVGEAGVVSVVGETVDNQEKGNPAGAKSVILLVMVKVQCDEFH